jgi:DNA-directed RNA polymerase subunit RPC12/RpoP
MSEYDLKVKDLERQIESSKRALAKNRETLQTCKAKDLVELTIAQNAIQQTLQVNEKLLHDLERVHRVQVEQKAGEKEKARKLGLIEKILKSPPPPCPYCGHNKYVKPRVIAAPYDAKPEQLVVTPERVVFFERNGGWTIRSKGWRVEFVCENPDDIFCRKIIHVYPDAPPENQEEQ